MEGMEGMLAFRMASQTSGRQYHPSSMQTLIWMEGMSVQEVERMIVDRTMPIQGTTMLAKIEVLQMVLEEAMVVVVVVVLLVEVEVEVEEVEEGEHTEGACQ